MAATQADRDRPLALAYVRVSTAIQVEGASLEAQRNVLRKEAEERDWNLAMVVDEGYSAKNLKRPGLTGALERLDAGDAQILIATRLDRVSRSVGDFAGLLARAHRRSWRLVLLSPALDTQDPAGKFTAYVLAAAAEYERDLIAARTREGMAQRRLEGHRLGRPRVVPESVVARVVEQRIAGATLQQIADALEGDHVPTARRSGPWRASSIQGLLESQTGQRLLSGLGQGPGSPCIVNSRD